jgi:hypothetical protein
MKRNPTRIDSVIFQAKATVFRALRFGRDLVSGPCRCQRLPLNGKDDQRVLVAESRSDLWDPSASAAERVLQAGKVQNLRIAARRLDGIQVSTGQRFSFWKQVGWPGRMRGYVRGRELRQGCLIPTSGGGLCQLSNALYDCALKAACTIEERHAHTQIVPGSMADINRDATIFWNYVDLRFRANRDLALHVDLTADELIVRLQERA